jgi:hypothetical protein
MVLEEDIPSFAVWIVPALLTYVLTAGLVAVGAATVAWLVQAAVHGPLAAGDRVYRGVLTGLSDLAGTSPRRVWALARLAIQESLRRNVLVVLAVFALVVLFAGWFRPASTPASCRSASSSAPRTCSWAAWHSCSPCSACRPTSRRGPSRR